ncbi:phosphate signaling complex protein PhoU [Paraburkholderia hospita]|uniref:phosphate signaling complex protein PhoU n=1 Tax=Paraburkholderia hospita TaxID=169430 RepID=UPI0009A7F4DE|nr:phosphate signaling complex protein PhoU [Paraburkholderia hospita]OUL97642.1 phosphate transport system regulatory protein PhoU [Paraburkholderia hospita]SKD04808.1 phosphate transport system regulatory protein PhoU [Burkholderia sp. CF099]
MSDKHLSSQFDAALNLLSTWLLKIGGLVESQISAVLTLLSRFDRAVVLRVRDVERWLNQMEVEIDDEINNIIARRQPAARDLRLLMATFKCVTNLEQAGDEAWKIAKRLQKIDAACAATTMQIAELRNSGEMALTILHRSLDAFARMDVVAAAQIMRDNLAIDNRFRLFVQQLVADMNAAPGTISPCLDYLFIAKAIERIGDHATNIAEFVIYIVKGRDVRHLPLARLEEEILRS